MLATLRYVLHQKRFLPILFFTESLLSIFLFWISVKLWKCENFKKFKDGLSSSVLHNNICVLLILINSFNHLWAPWSTHVWKKYLDQLQSPLTAYTSYQSFEKMWQFDTIFIIFGRAVLEAIEVKGCSILNFEVVTWKFGIIAFLKVCLPTSKG